MYRMGIWLIALALVFNGAAGYAEVDLSDAPYALVHHHLEDADAADCDTHAEGAAVAARHASQPGGPVHNHLKCCARCSLVSVLPGVAAVPAVLAYGSAVFYTAQHDLVGRPVALDPHIPKPIA